MSYDYDVIVIGMGPAGMAASAMGAEMGLHVAAFERRTVGGECMNVGCIPSKALLRIAKHRHAFERLEDYELEAPGQPVVKQPFQRIQNYLSFINDKKTLKMVDKVNLHFAEAHFVDPHTVEAEGKTHTAKRIFIATGTKPGIPPIPGLADVDPLTNETIFSLAHVPKSMVIVGAGAIGCEMAQAFQRLGCQCTLIDVAPRLIPRGDEEASALLQEIFTKEGIKLRLATSTKEVKKTARGVEVVLDDETITAERILVAAGRRVDFSSLALDKAGVKFDPKLGIIINRYLQTSQKHIYAIGDCNGKYLFSHAAMHQGMLALMNALSPWPIRFAYDKYPVPWTVFTDPQISFVGNIPEDATRYQVIKERYDNYGAAIAEGVPEGFVKTYASPWGKIFATSIVGDGSGEMINEWALAIQHNIRLHKIMMTQHSFPTMGFLTKRISETWMMGKMPWIKKFARWF